MEKQKIKKIALVTGANRGIGFETCRQLSQLNLTVLLTARDTTKGEVATKQLTDKGLDVIYYQLDVSNKNNIKSIFDKIEQQFGRLDILINNAAILYDTDQSTINADLEQVSKALDNKSIWPLANVPSIHSIDGKEWIWSYCKCIKWSRFIALYGRWDPCIWYIKSST